MKETRLGDFEETLLLLVGILDKEAYAFKVAEEFENQTKRAVSIGAVHSTLNRLGEKGFLSNLRWEQQPLNVEVGENASIPLQHLDKRHYKHQEILKYLSGISFQLLRCLN